MFQKMYEATILFIKVTGCLSVQCDCLSVAKDLASRWTNLGLHYYEDSYGSKEGF